jgi:NAD-dependent dihydropyrimidine dehydrogenase PreA subunit
LLYKILALLFTEKEAALVSRLPLRPVSTSAAARIWQVTEKEASVVLVGLASKALLLDIEKEGEMVYLLPPPMAGFFEFSLMRVRSDIDQRRLSELFFEYLNVEQDFIRELLGEGETAIGRVFVNEAAIGDKSGSVVLDYERASEVIRSASHLAVGQCYCRHKMSHLNRSCDAPQEVCMTLGITADSLIRHNNARRIEASEGLDLLQEAWSRNLVQCGDNVREGVNFICHCCSCCCEPLLAVRRLAALNPIQTTNFIPSLKQEQCCGCGKCVNICPVEALALVSANDFRDQGKRKAVFYEERCIGCGLCTRICRQAAISLIPRPHRVITPVNTAHRVVLMALERGKLPQLFFDNQLCLSHRAMAAVIGAILKLSPVKRLLAHKQIKSRYLERLLEGVDVGRLTITS